MALNLRLKAASEPEYPSLQSPHFILSYEAPRPPAGILNDLEGLRAKLLLDLVSFAPWAKEEKIRIILYKDQESYHRQSSVATWADGHVDLANRTIHCYDNQRLRRTLAHEMAHLFFDDYFHSRRTRSPVWLTEGVAAVMEWDYGLEESRPREEHILLREPIPLGDFLFLDYGGGEQGDHVAKWYLQAYSLTKFLMRRFSHGQFVEFSRMLATGHSMEAALTQGYGMQMKNVRDMESLWRRDLLARSRGD